MSRLNASFILGYHGCSEEVGLSVLRGDQKLAPSDKSYDWLGPGVYFWEGDPVRAYEWAIAKKNIEKPFVLGAVIDLGNCLDLMARENHEILKNAHRFLSTASSRGNRELPINVEGRRNLDCAVIKTVHFLTEKNQDGADSGAAKDLGSFDTVRGLFEEGQPLYPGSGFREKTHTQIAVVNDDCIKGYFIPRYRSEAELKAWPVGAE
ncbi:conserved hypothetical protein [uncultured Gammaproteobacteria bacterium]